MPVTDIRQLLLAAFEVEHRDHVDAIRRAFAPDGRLDLREVFRRAHSLKGAARAVDLPVVEDLAHQLEALFSEAMDSDTPFDRAALEQIGLILDRIEVAATQTGAQVEAVTGPLASEEPVPPTPVGIDRPLELLRVDPEELALLSEAAHEVSTRLAEQMRGQGALRRLHAEAARLERLWSDLHKQTTGDRNAVKARDFDAGLKDLKRELQTVARDQERALWAASQGATRVREQAERMAMTPADLVLGELGRMVRQLARDTGVEVEITVIGLETQAERRVLQALKDPITQLLRNAVSHGAEPVAKRRAAGKPDALHVLLEMSAVAGRLEIHVSDDGPGPDLTRLRAAAEARGALIPTLAGEHAPSPDEILATAFEAGVSSASQVDRLSGRGMGLSIVAEAVRGLGGSVRLEAAKPFGARVVLSAPLNTSRRSLIQVEAGGATYALPGVAGARLLRLDASALESVEGHPAARIELDSVHVVVPIVPLTALLTHTPATIPTHGGMASAVLVSRGDRHLAVAVDGLTNVAPALVQAMTISGVDSGLTLGVAVLEDETPAVVLNPDALMDRWLREHRRLAGGGLGEAQHVEGPAQATRTVLVVDDSITTRTLEKSILEAQGYRVILAVDGLDALNALRSGEAIVDLVVADIEMPRMDGFSLLQAIKADAALSALPVILMTSRADPEDVRRGLDLGAEAYITKQKFDQRELLATIGRVL